MLNNSPLKMILQESFEDQPREVWVYDFMHDTVETFQSLALCWDPSSKVWLTIPVACISPIEHPRKQKLNETVDNT